MDQAASADLPVPVPVLRAMVDLAVDDIREGLPSGMRMTIRVGMSEAQRITTQMTANENSAKNVRYPVRYLLSYLLLVFGLYVCYVFTNPVLTLVVYVNEEQVYAASRPSIVPPDIS